MQKNFDNTTMNNIKNLVDNGDISKAISQISPEMIENFSKMLNNNQNNASTSSTQSVHNSSSKTYSNSSSTNTATNEYSQTNTNNSNENNIDIDTIMKIKTVLEKMNNTNDPSHNLLNSLKPYLRESKQEKLNQYANLLNLSKISDIFNNNN